MHPSFEQFVAALRAPEQRGSIRLAISDEDAASLMSRDDWARDYYAQWIGMFPAEPAETVTAVPASAAPPPGGLGTGARVLLVGLVVVCIGVAATALIIPTLTGANRASHTTAANTASHSSATPSAAPTDANGFTSSQAEFVNAELAVSNTSISELVASGMTPQKLHDAADLVMSIADIECTVAAKTPSGFDTPGAKEKFITGLTQGVTMLGKTVTPTPAQADRIWTATAAYCAAH